MLLCAPRRKLRFLTLPSPRKVNPPLGNAYEYWSAGLRTLLHGLGRACSSLLGVFSSRICTVSECMRVAGVVNTSMLAGKNGSDDAPTAQKSGSQAEGKTMSEAPYATSGQVDPRFVMLDNCALNEVWPLPFKAAPPKAHRFFRVLLRERR